MHSRSVRRAQIRSLANDGPWADIVSAMTNLGPYDQWGLQATVTCPVVTCEDLAHMRALYPTWKLLSCKLHLVSDISTIEALVAEHDNVLSDKALNRLARHHAAWVMSRDDWCSPATLRTVLRGGGEVANLPPQLPVKCASILLARCESEEEVADVLSRVDSQTPWDAFNVAHCKWAVPIFLQRGDVSILHDHPEVTLSVSTVSAVLKDHPDAASRVIHHQIEAGVEPHVIALALDDHAVFTGKELPVRTLRALSPNTRALCGTLWTGLLVDDRCVYERYSTPETLANMLLHAAMWSYGQRHDFFSFWTIASEMMRCAACKTIYDRMGICIPYMESDPLVVLRAAQQEHPHGGVDGYGAVVDDATRPCDVNCRHFITLLNTNSGVADALEAAVEYLSHVESAGGMNDIHLELEDTVYSWLVWAVSRVNGSSVVHMACDYFMRPNVNPQTVVALVLDTLRQNHIKPTVWVGRALSRLERADVTPWVDEPGCVNPLPFASRRRFATWLKDHQANELDRYASRFMPECHAKNIVGVTALPDGIIRQMQTFLRHTQANQRTRLHIARLAVQTDTAQLLRDVPPADAVWALRRYVDNEDTLGQWLAAIGDKAYDTEEFTRLLETVHPDVCNSLLDSAPEDVFIPALRRAIRRGIPYKGRGHYHAYGHGYECMRAGRVDLMHVDQFMDAGSTVRTGTIELKQVPVRVLEAWHINGFVDEVRACIANDAVEGEMSNNICDRMCASVDGTIALATNTTTPYARACVAGWVRAVLASGDTAVLARLRGAPPLDPSLYHLIVETESLYLALHILNDPTNVGLVTALIATNDRRSDPSYVGLMLASDEYWEAFCQVSPFDLSPAGQMWLAAACGRKVDAPSAALREFVHAGV